MGLGGAQGCLDMTLRYCNEREQFGRPIATFQANAFKMADMAMEIECARCGTTTGRFPRKPPWPSFTVPR